MKLILLVLGTFTLVGCATVEIGTKPLTTTEHNFFARADPSAAVIVEVTQNTIDVTNNTFPAKFWGDIIGLNRAVDISQTVSRIYPNTRDPYRVAAINFCLKKGLWPTSGVEVAPHTKRFVCQNPNQAALYFAEKTVKSCEHFRTFPGALLEYRQRGYYTDPRNNLHICSTSTAYVRDNPPPNFCDAYTTILGINQGSTSTCSSLASRYASVSQRSLISSPSNQPASHTSSEAGQCAQMGFKPKTAEFSSCQLQIRQLVLQQKQFEAQQLFYEQQTKALQQQSNFDQAQVLFGISSQAYGAATGARNNPTAIQAQPRQPLPIAPIRITPPSGRPFTCSYQGVNLVCR
jgi:hypothetical protein